jgi:hypothetical protein
MSELRKLAREVSELADRYDAVMALDEAALADQHRRAEAFDRVLEWSKDIGLPCEYEECPHGYAECERGFSDAPKCWRELWMRLPKEEASDDDV